MKKIAFLLVCFYTISYSQEVRQVSRNVEGGMSIIRENIILYKEFNFFRDWSKMAVLKSGIGEKVELFPVYFNVPDKKVELYGLQLDVEVKPQKEGIEVKNSGSI